MSNLPKTLVAKLFYHLSHIRKKIIEFLMYCGRKFGKVFPSIRKIAWYCKCTTRCVKKFLKWNALLGDFFFKVIPRKRLNGSDTTHEYDIDKDLIYTYAWLYKRGLHTASFEKSKEIISSIEKLESSPPPYVQSSPPYTDSSSKRYLNTTAPINNSLKELRISEESKIYLTRNFSEYILNATLNSFWYAKAKGSIRKRAEAYLIGTAKLIKLKHSELQKGFKTA